MKILVTGATGLIGQELISELLGKGYAVNYLTTSLNKKINKPNCYGYYWNPDAAAIDEDCLINVDAIIHLAGASIAKRWTKAYKQEILDSRVLSAQLLFNTLKNNPHQVKHFISASAVGIYPESEIISYDETTTETDSGFLAEVVKKWEESADAFKKLHIKVTKVRTGLVLAAKGGALPEIAKPIKWGFGANIGNGRQIQSWIHITDLVRIYSLLVEKQLDGIYNAVSPNQVSNAKLTQTIAHVLRKPLFLPNIPEFALKLILGEMALMLFSSKNCSANKIVKTGFRFQFPTIESAIKDIYQ